MKQDYFEQKLAQKLKNQEMTPPADLWQRLEATLDSAPLATTAIILPRRKRFLGLVVGGTAVAAALLLSFLLINVEKEIETSTIATIATTETTAPNPLSAVQTIQDTLQQKMVTNQIAENRVIKKRAIKAPLTEEATIASDEVQKVENTTSTEQATEQATEQPKENTQRKTRSASSSASNSPIQHSYAEVTGKGKRSKQSGIRLNISGSGSVGSASSVTNKDMFAANIRELSGARPVMYTSAEKRVNWEHTIPISISATVQKMFTRKIGIETGLTYTYLSSHSNVDTKPKIDIKQRLHYLGIPISIVYNIAQAGNFNFYAKGGFLVDKAVSTEYKTYLENKSTTDKLSSKGVQWSSSLQVGAEYKIGQLLTLYIEPTANYYFDSKQPESYRTENDFGFSAAVGVRFKL